MKPICYNGAHVIGLKGMVEYRIQMSHRVDTYIKCRAQQMKHGQSRCVINQRKKLLVGHLKNSPFSIRVSSGPTTCIYGSL